MQLPYVANPLGNADTLGNFFNNFSLINSLPDFCNINIKIHYTYLSKFSYNRRNEDE